MGMFFKCWQLETVNCWHFYEIFDFEYRSMCDFVPLLSGLVDASVFLLLWGFVYLQNLSSVCFILINGLRNYRIIFCLVISLGVQSKLWSFWVEVFISCRVTLFALLSVCIMHMFILWRSQWKTEITLDFKMLLKWHW